MNIVKKIAIAATFLCAATTVNAEGIAFGARLGYSLQSTDGGTLFAVDDPYDKTDVNMGMLGIGAGVVVNIPAGPVVIAPEVGFLYRTVANIESKYEEPGFPSETSKGKITEFAVSVPIMVKFFPIEALYIAAGFQLDIPIGSEICDDKGKDCEKLDGKTETITEEFYGQTYTYEEEHAERTLDMGIPIGIGYMVTPNLSVDFRFVLGLNNIIKYEFEEDFGPFGKLSYKFESGSMNTFGLGVTYFF
jgi:hypothetical protein